MNVKKVNVEAAVKNEEKIREMADGILYMCNYALVKKIPAEILAGMIKLKLEQLLSDAD